MAEARMPWNSVSHGSFANSMQWARFGIGDKNLLWIPGGPGSELPSGVVASLTALQMRPLIDAGFSVWVVSRVRFMATGTTVADMANDYAEVIASEFGGKVAAVVGLSYGGMIVQYLAADHSACAHDFVIALSAATITDWGRDVDHRWAASRVYEGPRRAAEVMAEYVFPKNDNWWQRRLVAAALSPLTGGDHLLDQDLLVEAEAELHFDARDVLPRIAVPVLLITAGDDLFFTADIVNETEALIAQCTTITYEGIGHLRAMTSMRLTRDIAAYLSR